MSHRARTPDPPDGSDGGAWPSVLAPIAVALVPLIAQVVAIGRDLRWSAPGGSDYAGFELNVRTALHGDLLLGASSRLGVFNLGPVQAYWAAPWYVLTGEGMGGMVLSAWLAHAAAVAFAVVTVRAVAGRRAAWFAGTAIALGWLRAGPTALSDFYNPALTMPAVLVATIAAAALARGRWRALPLLAGAASIGAQLHFASAPGLLLIAAAALGAAWRTGRPARRDLVVAGVLLALLWAPAVIDQVAGSGNLSDLVAAVQKGPADPDQPHGMPERSAPRLERSETAVELVALTAPNSATFGTLPGIAAPYLHRAALPGPSRVRAATALVLCTAALAVAWVSRRRSALGSLVVAFALLGAVVTYLLTAGATRGFQFYYLAPLPGYGIAACVGLALIAEQRFAPMARRGVAAVAVAVIACVGVFGAFIDDTELATVNDVPVPRGQVFFADAAADAVPAGCRNGGVALRVRIDQVADLWTVMVALDRRGLHTTVDKAVEPFAGPGHRRTGREAVVASIPQLEDLERMVVPAGAIRVRGCT